MKKSLLLIPSLVALSATPFIGLTSCFESENDPKPEPTPPEPEYHSYELKPDGVYLKTDKFTLFKNDYYKFWSNSIDWTTQDFYFWFGYNEETDIIVNVSDVKVFVSGFEVEFEEKIVDDCWLIKFIFDPEDLPGSLEIDLKCNETRNNVYGYAY